MRTPVFTGVCTALVTPFHQSGRIDFDAFGKLIDYQISAGVDAVCVCGTTGESSTMSIREHIAAVEFCVKRVNHRVKVIAGCGSNDTSAAVYLSLHAQESGADALPVSGLSAWAGSSRASMAVPASGEAWAGTSCSMKAT